MDSSVKKFKILQNSYQYHFYVKGTIKSVFNSDSKKQEIIIACSSIFQIFLSEKVTLIMKKKKL